jgi:hypothetical protein
MAYGAKLIFDLCLHSHIDCPQAYLGRVVIYKRQRPYARRPAKLRQMHVAQGRIEVSFEVINRIEVRPGDGELYECVMNKVFGLLAIMSGQLQRPP